MILTGTRRAASQIPSRFVLRCRTLSTLQNNPNIYTFRSPLNSSSTTLSLLPTDPPSPSLAIGTSTQDPPTVHSFQGNSNFLNILNSVLAEHAHSDPSVISQASALASSAGAVFKHPNRRNASGQFGGSSEQGGAGGANRGGFVHVYDHRHPPDYGRIPDPEDIFGSVEVEANGEFTDGHGRYQPSGTYRMCTNDGILGLSDFLRGKLVERLKLEQAAEKR